MKVTSRPKAAKPVPPWRNGVGTPALFAAIGAVADNPELAKVQVRASGP